MKRLKKGDTIGLIAPASSVNREKLKEAIKNLEELGFNIKIGKSVESVWYSFAGTDEDRAKDINNFFQDRDIDAIMCVRGGYGGIRMLTLLDYENILVHVFEKNERDFYNLERLWVDSKIVDIDYLLGEE